MAGGKVITDTVRKHAEEMIMKGGLYYGRKIGR